MKITYWIRNLDCYMWILSRADLLDIILVMVNFSAVATVKRSRLQILGAGL